MNATMFFLSVLAVVICLPSPVLAQVDPIPYDHPHTPVPVREPVRVEPEDPIPEIADEPEGLSEDWASNPFDRGWVNGTGIPGTGDLGWNSVESGFLFEDEPYPATGSTYYSLMILEEDARLSGSFSIGNTGGYELVGLGMYEDTENYSFIYYDKYRKDLRFIKCVDGVSLCDLSPDHNLDIPAGAPFTISMSRSGSDYVFSLQYGSQGYSWSVQDSIGTSIVHWYPAVGLRYLGSRCYSLQIDDDTGLNAEAGRMYD